MRVKVLFWNYDIGKGSLMAREPIKADPLARIARRRDVDILIVAECTLPTEEILKSLSAHGLAFSGTDLPHDRIRFFRRASGPELVPVLSDERLDFQRLTSRGFEEVLIGGVHLDDRQHTPLEQSRHSKVGLHYRTLIEAERTVEHGRTILVGDFNMTPNEMGMVDPENAFGAVMTWDLARVHSDPTHGGTPRFFNPMWSLMGRSEAPGTYFWDSTDAYNIYWYCLDRVIARPSLRGIFLDESPAILTTIPDRVDQSIDVPLFRSAVKHWKIEFSDHPPILFELDLREQNSGASHG